MFRILYIPTVLFSTTVAFIDAEHALDIVYAKKLGVMCNELLVSQPDTGEEVLEIAKCLVPSNALDVAVIDSVAALAPRAEIEDNMGSLYTWVCRPDLCHRH